MTTKHDSKRKPKSDERPKVKKEKLKDLDTAGTPEGEGVKGGSASGTADPNQRRSQGCYTGGCAASI
jgi:hypothetical protein